MLSGVLGRFRAGGDSPSPPRRQTSGGDGGGVGAVKWIRVQDGGRGTEPQMVVSDEASREVLRPLGSKKPLNMVAIMGAARQGKSFLMNQLARKDDVFRISNAKEPCTQGVDISRAVLPCDAFYPRAKNGPMVALVDVEGQGDRSVDHDARLATSILPVSECLLHTVHLLFLQMETYAPNLHPSEIMIRSFVAASSSTGRTHCKWIAS